MVLDGIGWYCMAIDYRESQALHVLSRLPARAIFPQNNIETYKTQPLPTPALVAFFLHPHPPPSLPPPPSRPLTFPLLNLHVKVEQDDSWIDLGATKTNVKCKNISDILLTIIFDQPGAPPKEVLLITEHGYLFSLTSPPPSLDYHEYLNVWFQKMIVQLPLLILAVSLWWGICSSPTLCYKTDLRIMFLER